MTVRQNLKYQLLAAWSGMLFELLFFIFWSIIGHNMPPVSPNLSGPELAAYFVVHHNGILLGNSVTALIAVLWVTWTAQLTVVMWRIEGASPVLTIVQLGGGILTAWALMFSPAFWVVAALRPDIEPNIIRAMNDLGWIIFNITYAVTSVQAIAAGLVGLSDKSEHPVFSRFVSIWAILTGLIFVPLTAVPFFKTGPLAWDGAYNFWVPLIAYFIWTSTMGFAMLRDARRRLREEDRRVSGVAPATSL